MTQQILSFVAIGILVLFVVRNLSHKQSKDFSDKTKTAYHYKRKDYMMTRSEHDFFDILVKGFGDRFFIFPQANIGSILDHKVEGQNWRAARAHINRMSVDYVMCDRSSVRPLVAIELDDPSHEREDRRARDKDLSRILTEARLPLVRFSNVREMDKTSIIQRVTEKLPVSS